MKEMTVRERMLRVYCGELPDQWPVGIYQRYLPRGTWERRQRDAGLGIIAYYPISTLMSPPWHLHAGFISEVKGVEFQVSYQWIDGQKTEVRTFQTKVGTVSQHTARDPVYGSDWISKYYIASEEDYKIVQYITEQTVFASNEKDIVRLKQDLGDDGVLLGRIDRTPFQKLIIELAGPEQFLIDISTGLKAAEELLEVMGLKHRESFAAIDETCADAIWQPENVTADMTPPVFFEKYCMPYYAAVAEKCAVTKKPYVVHLDGRLQALTEQLNRCAFNGIESFSYSEVGGDISLSELRERCPGKIVLPNFPSSLSGQDEAAINAWLDKTLSEAGTDQAFMLQISEDIPPDDLPKVARLLCAYMQQCKVG